MTPSFRFTSLSAPLGVVLALAFGCASSYTADGDGGVPSLPTRDAQTDSPTDAGYSPEVDASAARPIFGGHGLVTGGSLYFADPERDQLFRFEDVGGELEERLRLNLPVGSAPFRLTDADGVIFATLRGAGAVARVEDDVLRSFAPVCDAPRGVASDGARIFVACAGGELVTLDREGHEQRRIFLEPDLRDVVVDARGHVYVSVFRSADVLELDTSLRAQARHAIPDEHPADVSPDGLPSEARLANTAWRMRAHAEGGVEVLHQLSTGRLMLPDASDPNRLGFGGQTRTFLCERPVVSNALTRLLPDGTFERVRIGGGGLAVDFTHDVRGELFVAYGVMFIGALSYDVVVGRVTPFVDERGARCLGVEPQDSLITGGGLSVEAFADSIAYYDRRGGTSLIGAWTLPPPPDREEEGGVGPLFFHGSSGVPISCASCHAEGRDDGLVWDLGAGPRRTPSLVGGILETAPFGRRGEAADFLAMADVILASMTPGSISEELEAALGEWLNRLPVDAASSDPEAAARGAEVFATVGCASCHAGAAGTQSESVALDDGVWQVPSLRGVGLRFPYLHDGCAATLRDVLDGCEGRTPHPGTEALTAMQRDDLVAYLATWD